jgi:thiol-disulfide isomerase/thioredoxin
MPKALKASLRFVLGGCLLLGVVAPMTAAPAVGKMLEYQPRQEASITTPTAAEQASCKVELEKAGKGSAWVLKDPAGRPLRRFLASNDRNVDAWSYYKDGQEVYREVDTTGSGRPDHYRWLNAGGSRWGIDSDKDGKIDAWRAISPEEVSQEILRALATRDHARLLALFVTDEDAKALGLPKETADSYAERRKNSRTKFEAAIAKLTKLSPKATWMHLELPAPEAIPAEQAGTKVDLVRYSRGTVLYEAAGANEWFQTGQLIQVGAAWKITDAPTAGATTMEETKDGSKTMDLDPQVQKLVEELTAHDKKTPPSSGPAAIKHHLDRADILEKIVSAVKAQERDPWIRQVADSLASAAQASTTETVAAQRMAALESQLVKAVPGTNLTAYVSFRAMQADYSRRLSLEPKKFDEIQKAWLEKLTGFVKTYAKAEDTPDAMLQLGMVCEFLGKDVEAKNWYLTVAKTFPETPQGKKGEGAARRLGLEGQPMPIAAPLLETGSTFDVAQHKGKVVVVYYWASWNGNAASDFEKLKALTTAHKDVAVLAINLDDKIDAAKAFVSKNPTDATHVYQAGGLEGKLATYYGVQVLPAVFVIGKDGKCVSKNSQVSTLDEEVKKLKK